MPALTGLGGTYQPFVQGDAGSWEPSSHVSGAGKDGLVPVVFDRLLNCILPMKTCDILVALGTSQLDLIGGFGSRLSSSVNIPERVDWLERSFTTTLTSQELVGHTVRTHAH